LRQITTKIINDMKKGLMFFTLIGALALSNGVWAQTKVGGFFGYGSDVDQWGIGGIAEFGLNDKWAISPSLLFYFAESNSNYKYSWYEFNVNANYYFFKEGVANLYGIGGLNYIVSKSKEKFGDENSTSNGELGLNLGMGSNFDIGKKILPFVEMKFVLGEADQLGIFFGVKYSL